jgi:tRNA G18 (ribose-2'-O)-methylase SpoU
MKSNERGNKILILHNIRSAQNVGALFRTADAAGISAVYLSGITALPIDRFGREDSAVTKASLGAEKSLHWEYHESVLELVQQLKSEGVMVVAIEQAPKAADYKTVEVTLPVAFILGNEVDGIESEVLALADVVAEIPMKGEKESLNVSVAGGIALFRMLGV